MNICKKKPSKIVIFYLHLSIPFSPFLSPHASPASFASAWSSPPPLPPSTGARGRHGRRCPRARGLHARRWPWSSWHLYHTAGPWLVAPFTRSRAGDTMEQGPYPIGIAGRASGGGASMAGSREVAAQADQAARGAGRGGDGPGRSWGGAGGCGRHGVVMEEEGHCSSHASLLLRPPSLAGSRCWLVYFIGPWRQWDLGPRPRALALLCGGGRRGPAAASAVQIRVPSLAHATPCPMPRTARLRLFLERSGGACQQPPGRAAVDAGARVAAVRERWKRREGCRYRRW